MLDDFEMKTSSQQRLFPHSYSYLFRLLFIYLIFLVFILFHHCHWFLAFCYSYGSFVATLVVIVVVACFPYSFEAVYFCHVQIKNMEMSCGSRRAPATAMIYCRQMLKVNKPTLIDMPLWRWRCLALSSNSHAAPSDWEIMRATIKRYKQTGRCAKQYRSVKNVLLICDWKSALFLKPHTHIYARTHI